MLISEAWNGTKFEIGDEDGTEFDTLSISRLELFTLVSWFVTLPAGYPRSEEVTKALVYCQTTQLCVTTLTFTMRFHLIRKMRGIFRDFWICYGASRCYLNVAFSENHISIDSIWNKWETFRGQRSLAIWMYSTCWVVRAWKDNQQFLQLFTARFHF